MASNNGSMPKLRAELEAEHGRVFDTRELAAEFVVMAIIVPGLIMVRRKFDGVVGRMLYQDGMRFYFGFVTSPDQ